MTRHAMQSILFILFTLVCTFGHNTAAMAQINIAVVDVERVLSEAKASKSIQKQVDKKREAFLSEVKKEEDKLRNEQKAIEAKRNELSKEELIKKAQEFEKRRIDARKKIQANKASLDKAYNEAMNKLTRVIYEASQEIADEDGIDLVITRQNIIVGNMSLDITKKVVTRINKKLPKLNL
ncbi:MAG: OmpH family outer membrane protein [Alphaproteobacteria bacterium]